MRQLSWLVILELLFLGWCCVEGRTKSFLPQQKCNILLALRWVRSDKRQWQVVCFSHVKYAEEKAMILWFKLVIKDLHIQIRPNRQHREKNYLKRRGLKKSVQSETPLCIHTTTFMWNGFKVVRETTTWKNFHGNYELYREARDKGRGRRSFPHTNAFKWQNNNVEKITEMKKRCSDNHSLTDSLNQSVNQSVNRSPSQSIRQSDILQLKQSEIQPTVSYTNILLGVK